jgi:hypothetical protein
MTRSTHPNKDIEKALRHAEDHGWRIKESTGRGHAWGSLYCPYNDAECRCGEFCITSVWSTPKSPDNHGRQLRRVVDNCTTRRHQPPNTESESPDGL